MTTLSPVQFPELFHGSATDVEDRVLPRAQTGVRPNHPGKKDATGRSDRYNAHASSEESSAWFYAHSAAEKVNQRSRVYEVEATHPDTQVGIYNATHPKFGRRVKEDWGEYIAPEFEVKRQLDVMPGQQGTLPQIDWEQHRRAMKGPVLRAYADALNHPTAEEIETGHQGSTMRLESMKRALGEWEPEYRDPEQYTPAIHDRRPGPGQGLLWA